MSPKLFTLYINDITGDLGNEIDKSLFADDLAVWTQHEKPEECEKRMQKAIDKIYDWARKWRMQLNASKTEYILFTSWNKEAKWEGNLKIGNEKLKRNNAPKFLGVKFDWNMTFNNHVKAIKNKMRQRLRAIKAVSHKNWGNSTEDLRALFIGFVRSVAEYAGAAWINGASDTTVKEVEVEQNKGARIITGCLASTPIDKLLVEADLVPLKVRGEILATNAAEKYKRDNRNPNRKLVEKAVKTTTKREEKGRSWRAAAWRGMSKAGTENLRTENIVRSSSVPPWEETTGVKIKTELPDGSSKKDEDQIKLVRSAEKTIKEESEEADVEIYTDGSVQEGQRKGGSGCWLKYRTGEEKEITKPAGEICSSFRAEAIAIQEGLKEIEKREGIRKVALFTDSKAVLTKMKAGAPDQELQALDLSWMVLKKLNDRGVEVNMQWVPSHVGVIGNEKADEVANRASLLGQEDSPIDYKTVKARTARKITEEWRENIEHTSWKRGRTFERSMSRKERTTLATLRTGHSYMLRAYRKRVGQEEDGTCEDCGVDEETRDHLLFDCAAHMEERARIWGKRIMNGKRERESVKPDEVMAYLRGIGRFAAGDHA